jgi:hypothetical protein
MWVRQGSRPGVSGRADHRVHRESGKDRESPSERRLAARLFFKWRVLPSHRNLSRVVTLLFFPLITSDLARSCRGRESLSQICKSQQYPSENPISILVGKLFGDSLPTRILVVKATSLMLGFTLICEEVSYRSSSFSCANCGEDCTLGIPWEKL